MNETYNAAEQYAEKAVGEALADTTISEAHYAVVLSLVKLAYIDGQIEGREAGIAALQSVGRS